MRPQRLHELVLLEGRAAGGQLPGERGQALVGEHELLARFGEPLGLLLARQRGDGGVRLPAHADDLGTGRDAAMAERAKDVEDAFVHQRTLRRLSTPGEPRRDEDDSRDEEL